MANTKVEKESIEVIASGYEWICPHCDTLNKEIEITETMACSNCDKTFPVHNYHHAYGN